MRHSAPAAGARLFAPLQASLETMGAAALQRSDAMSTGDLNGLEQLGVPCFQPLIDSSDYFNYHHTAADTLDKVDPQNLRRHVAVIAAYTWYLANMDDPLGRWSAPPKP